MRLTSPDAVSNHSVNPAEPLNERSNPSPTGTQHHADTSPVAIRQHGDGPDESAYKSYGMEDLDPPNHGIDWHTAATQSLRSPVSPGDSIGISVTGLSFPAPVEINCLMHASP